MNCNKEEAIRAKEIAERRMHDKDFFGAKKIALKAQHLFPDLDNISQMLTVCEVHCSAGVKVNGEIDLYGILQVEPTADELCIKKHYRKLALLLHPDKNKFPGAEAAFKLIGEANMTLADPAKRSIYDMKRKTNNRSGPSVKFSQHPSSTYVRKQSCNPNNISNNSTARANGINQQQHSSASSGDSTFWTACPFCTMKLQYHRNILNRTIRCCTCLRSFIAKDINVQAAPSRVNLGFSWSHSQTPQQEFPFQNAPNTGFQRDPGNVYFSMSFQGNVGGRFTAQQPFSSSGNNTGEFTKRTEDKVHEEGGAGNNMKSEEEKLKQVNKSERVVKPSTGNASRKRVRKIEESSESDSTDSEDMVIEEDGYPEEQRTGTAGSRYPRRSTRHRKNVVYNESEDDGIEDDDSVSRPSSESFQKVGSDRSDPRFSHKSDNKQKGVSHEENSLDENKPANIFKMHDSGHGVRVDGIYEPAASSNTDSDVDSSSGTSPHLGSFTYPDPEFCDFEKNRDTSQFALDQIWAMYDNIDGMPRFYALIRNVYNPDFKVRYTWLEHNPMFETELVWSEAELPVACGNYTLGKAEYTQDRLSFSHLMSWERGTSSRRKSYNIYPRKGEVWALFKGWDINWSSDKKSHKHYEYEVVEALTDYAEGSGIVVEHLVRIEGYVCLFTRSKDQGMTSLSITPAEMLRFSHMVPSYKLARGEREGIPEGCFELDSTSLPSNFEAAFPAVSLDDVSAADADKLAAGTDKNSAELDDKNVCDTKEMSPSPPASPCSNSFEYPDSEFYNFKEERSVEKFQCGQIWALYSEANGFPNYYGLINEVESEDFKLHVKWLEACSSKNKIAWQLEDLPIACGTFKVSCNETMFDTVDAFSHLVQVKQSNKKNQYDIFPCIGEVWAMFKNWSVEWTHADLGKCGYDVVEILEQADSGVKVVVLKKVNGYRAVFLPESKGVVTTLEISQTEYLRFAHRIPAFRLTEERGGTLQGCWELDPASLPEILLL